MDIVITNNDNNNNDNNNNNLKPAYKYIIYLILFSIIMNVNISIQSFHYIKLF